MVMPSSENLKYKEVQASIQRYFTDRCTGARKLRSSGLLHSE